MKFRTIKPNEAAAIREAAPVLRKIAARVGTAIDRKPVDGCRWFLLCDNPATTTVSHPILGDVPSCDRCAQRAKL